MEERTMSILSIENLSYTYPGGQKAVLREVNAAFEAGKMYAITGPSGSGKSTLLSLLAGMETPSEGGIVCEGESLADLDLDAYRREKISFVFQAYQLLPLLTARENVCLPMEMQGTPTAEAAERADALLLSVGLPENLHRRFPGNLSGGEQQRVDIARSLSSGAKIILADEPTGNLDDENTAAIMALLR
ncbi:MAG: ABC transporter ATP-binding protein, partial [Oscillospiraceae bacterium]|nr:ABC transporter ATP-binding protein [Oscillospiraceae bacterium]